MASAITLTTLPAEMRALIFSFTDLPTAITLSTQWRMFLELLPKRLEQEVKTRSPIHAIQISSISEEAKEKVEGLAINPERVLGFRRENNSFIKKLADHILMGSYAAAIKEGKLFIISSQAIKRGLSPAALVEEARRVFAENMNEYNTLLAKFEDIPDNADQTFTEITCGRQVPSYNGVAWLLGALELLRSEA